MKRTLSSMKLHGSRLITTMGSPATSLPSISGQKNKQRNVASNMEEFDLLFSFFFLN